MIMRIRRLAVAALLWQLLTGLLLALCVNSASAAVSPALVKAGERLPLKGYFDFFPESAPVDAQRLVTGDYDQLFQHVDGAMTDVQSRAVWLRFRIANGTDLPTQVLSTRLVIFTEARLVYNRAVPGQPVDIVDREIGFLHSPMKRDWPYYDIAWQLEIPPDQMRTVYLRLQSPYLVTLTPYVTEMQAYSLYQMQLSDWGHLMAGILLGVMLYVTMIAVYVPGLREVRHCLAFIAVSFLILIYMRGYLFGLLPHIPWLKLHLHSLLFSAQIFTYILFSRLHFRTSEDFVHVDQLLKGIQYLAVGLFVASLVLPVIWVVNAVTIVAFIVMLVLSISSVYVWANSQRHLTIYITGTLVFLFAGILLMAESAGFIDLGNRARFGYEAGICLQTILFALALAEKISDYQQSQTQLAINAAEARAENRAKTSFLAKMSHELRTPMNGLLGMLQLLERTPLNNQQQHYLQVMRNSGRLLLGVIDDVLDYSRITAGKLRIDEEDYDVMEVLADVEAMFTQAARQKSLQLHFAINTSTPMVVHGDATRLRQILINLVSNAIKFTEQGTISVRMQVEQDNSEEWLLYGEVEDTGIGISTEQMALLFREYAQVDGAKSYGGSGLGLVICKQLVEMMKGSIHADSAPGYGSLFRFQVVVKPPRYVAANGHSADNLPQRRINSHARILVAEDNETSREVLEGLLQQLGYRAEFVENGAEAVQRICRGNQRWDLVLMDVEMPVLDGIAATLQIRQWESEQYRNAIPIIALTAHATREHEEQSRRAGMDDHLSKPVDLTLLQNVLAKWLPYKAARTIEPE